MFNISFKYFLVWIPILLVISILTFVDLLNLKDDFITIIITITFIIVILVVRFEVSDVSIEIEIYLKRNYGGFLQQHKKGIMSEAFSALYSSLFKFNFNTNNDEKLKLLNNKASSIFLFFLLIQVYLIILIIVVYSKT